MSSRYRAALEAMETAQERIADAHTMQRYRHYRDAHRILRYAVDHLKSAIEAIGDAQGELEEIIKQREVQ